MPQLMIIGAGALARQVHSLFNYQPYHIVGFLDKPRFEGEEINGCPITETPLKNALYVIAVADPKAKKELAEKYKDLTFTTLIHQTAIISKYTKFPIGTIIYPYVIIDPNVELGNHTTICYHAFIGHHAEIADYSTICSYASISGYTKLQTGSYMGCHSLTVNERYREHCLTLGEFCRVGAGAVVTKDVAAGETVIGNPAHPL